MKQYQKTINVKKHKITQEWKPLWTILSHLPNELKLYDIGAAEGFICWMAKQKGIKVATGIERHKDKVVSAMKHLEIKLTHGSIFDNINNLKEYNCFVFSRFLHNIGWEPSFKLMKEIDKIEDYIVIVKYKPGLFKENGTPRQPLAMKKGISRFMSYFNLKGKSFPQQLIVYGKGKYEYIPNKLRKYIKEG